MSALFARVVKQALITFERENYASFKSNFNVLKQLVDQLTSTDLNIPSELFGSNSFQQTSVAPVKYIEIFEHKTFTMSVFIVANKYTMPLHDHPGHGLLRVLSGTARIQSYTLENPLQNAPHILSAIEEAPIEFTAKNGCSVLTPTHRNLHEITAAGTSAAAFFDILSPPYESDLSIYGPKKCLFYRKVTIKPTVAAPGAVPTDTANHHHHHHNHHLNSHHNNHHNHNHRTNNHSDHHVDEEASSKSKHYAYLQQIRVPNSYYCDNIYYNPPDFLTNINLLNSIDV